MYRDKHIEIDKERERERNKKEQDREKRRDIRRASERETEKERDIQRASEREKESETEKEREGETENKESETEKKREIRREREREGGREGITPTTRDSSRGNFESIQRRCINFSIYEFLCFCPYLFHNHDALTISSSPSRMRPSIGPAACPPVSHKYLSMYLVDSVLPAPDSPETMIDWDCLRTFMSRYALSAAIIAYKKIYSTLFKHLEQVLMCFRCPITFLDAYRWRKREEAGPPGTFPCSSRSSWMSRGL
jgi:hypothetical protein